MRRNPEIEAEMDVVVEDLIVELHETWSESARAGALCARTRKPEHCAKAKELVKKQLGAVAGAAKEKLGAAAGAVQKKVGAVATAADKKLRSVLPTEANLLKQREENRKRLSPEEFHTWQVWTGDAAREIRQKYPPGPERTKRLQDLEDEAAAEEQTISPRHLKGPKRGQRVPGYTVHFPPG